MKNPMRKRLPRELRQDMGKYIVLFLFLSMMISLCSGFLVADLSMSKAYDESFQKYNIEDGHLELETKASDSLVEMLEEEDVTIYPLFFKDRTFQGKRTLRVFKNRAEVNLADIMEGRLPESADEIALDRLFALKNGVKTGDTVKVSKQQYKVTGLVALSDYSALFENNADSMFDATHFGVSVVTDEGYDRLGDDGERYRYVWKNNKPLTEKENQDKAEVLMDIINENAEAEFDKLWLQHPAYLMEMGLSMLTGGELDVSFAGVSSLTDLVPRAANQAIMFTGEDVGRDRVMILILLYILITIIAFVFAVTTRSTLEQEAGTIGTLLASGYRRTELVRHYLILPTIVMLVAALVGNILGYTYFKGTMAGLYYNSYSLPTYTTIWNADAFLITTLGPCFLITVINLVVLLWTLRLSPLQFLRHELKRRKHARAVRLPLLPFMTRFRIRVILQNKTGFLILALGVLLSSFLLLFGLILDPILNHFAEEIDQSMIAEYQYVLKAPVIAKTEGAERYYLETLEMENPYITEEVMVYGIQHDSRYLTDLDLPAAKGEVIASDSYMAKYKLSVGDRIELKKKYSSDTYRFTIAGSYPYAAGLTVFMDSKAFCDVFEVDRSEFTGYFSNEELEIREALVASVITRDDLHKISSQLHDSMGDMFQFIEVFAIILYLLLMYLLARLILDKNRDSISMLKILGYSDREAGSLYNSATFIVVIVTLLLGTPLTIVILGKVWELYLIQMHGWLEYYIAPWIPPVMIVAGILSYYLISRVLLWRVRKIPLSAALKNME